MGNHLDKYLKDPAITKLKPQFTKLELYMLAMLFKDLSSRHHGVIDKETFLQFFPLTGLWGERLFSKFDLKHTGHVSFYEFVQGIATCCHSTEDEKIHFLFSLYDIDQDNCIKKKEMITMLYNYPKEHIKFITDEIALDRGEKLGNVTELQRMSLQDLDDGDYDPDTRNQRFGSIHSDHIAGALNDELEVAEEEKLDSCIPREKKIDKTLSQLMQKEDIERTEVLSPPIDKTATDMINVAPRKKSAQPTGKEADNKDKKPVPNKTTSRNENGVSLVDSALKGVRKDSTSTVITDPSFLIATTVNTRVKEYASFMFKTFESSKKTGKIYYDDFKEWLHMHPMILRVFDETFHQDIWSTQHWDSKDRAKMSVLGYEEADKLVGKEGTLKPSDGKTLIYRERAPEFSGYLYKRGKTWNKRYCELRDHFLICYEKKDAVYPRAILFLDGCFIDDTKDYSTLHKYGFSVSHKSESYEPHKFYCNDKAEYDEWMKHLKLFQSNTIMDMYDFKEKIGTGKFSVVYRAITKDNKHDELAIKVIDKKALKAEEREFLFSELSVIKVLNHPSMIKLIDSIETRTHIYIVTELVKDGDLFDYIVSREYLEEYTASYLMKKLLVGVYYMHNMGVVHRDIKPENIMITLDSDSDGEVKELKIIDFGFAKLMDGDVQLTETCGTPNYVAPEVLRGVGYDKRSDLWSLGVIMYFMLRGYLPFDAHEVNTILKKTLKGYVPFDDAHWEKVSHQGKDLVMKFLNKDPKNRITIEDALKHPWIKDRESLKKYEGVNRKQEESGSDQS